MAVVGAGERLWQAVQVLDREELPSRLVFYGQAGGYAGEGKFHAHPFFKTERESNRPSFINKLLHHARHIKAEEAALNGEEGVSSFAATYPLILYAAQGTPPTTHCTQPPHHHHHHHSLATLCS